MKKRRSQRTIHLPNPIALRVFTRYQEKKLIVDVAPLADRFFAPGSKLELRVVHRQSSKVVAQHVLANPASGASQVEFSMNDLPDGCGELKASLTDALGRNFPITVLQDGSPGAMNGLAGNEGISSRVPAPWRPVRVREGKGDIEVECWGRRHVFGPDALVRRIDSHNLEGLTGPITLQGRVDGRQVRFKSRQMSIGSRDAGRVVIEHELMGANLRLATVATVEFDGCITFECSLSAAQPVQIQSLALEMPIPRSSAKYYYWYPGGWADQSNVGALPKRGISTDFKAYVWIGDEQRGISWFAESEQNWHRPEPIGGISTQRRGDAIVLRIQPISRPVELLPYQSKTRNAGGGPIEIDVNQSVAAGSKNPVVRGALSYRFGIQATPVKPVEKDAWDYRIFCMMQRTQGFDYQLKVVPEIFDRLATAGVKTVVIFEHWTDAESDPTTTHGETVKQIVRACHERGMQALLYFGFLISELSPVWPRIGKDCLLLPKRGYPLSHYAPQPDQAAWVVCLNSAWQEVLVNGIAKVMDEFDVDGVYLDGTALPQPCCNSLHGCGVLRENGSLTPNYPIFAVRSTLRRIFQSITSRTPDGQINIHNSANMVTPAIGWGTSSWDGEQFKFLPRSRTNLTEFLPLDRFRAEFIGRQWGVPSEYLCFGDPLKYHEAWALTLIHDVPVRPNDPRDELELASEIWRVMDEFDRKSSEWLPYWNNRQFIHVSPQSVYASFYRHARNGVLVAVSNVGPKRVSAVVRLNVKSLALEADELSVVDALSGNTIAQNPRAIRLSLPRLGWKLLWIRRGASRGVAKKGNRHDQTHLRRRDSL